MRDPAAHRGELLRAHGYVKAGTIVRVAPSITAFVMQWRGAELTVVYEGVLPDTFKDQSELVVTGTFDGEDDRWLLEGTQLVAKCGGKYDGNPRSSTEKFQ
jgi:cytochrome c-type biogenesis protein CcmE